jgi:hypothetical protein
MRNLGWLLLPLALLVALVAALTIFRPLDSLTAAAPPVEEISFSRVRLEPGLISLTVSADGSQPVEVAQVQVDAAYRVFTIDPPGPIKRLGTARVDVPYHWVEGEAHHVALVTSTGAVFGHTIEVAQASPRTSGEGLALIVLVGLLLGVAPVAVGMLAYPALRTIGNAGMSFLLALTAGLLLYLFIDTLMEGFGRAARRSGGCAGRSSSSSPRSFRRWRSSPLDGGAARRRRACGSRPSSHSASGCTISARGSRWVRRSRRALRRSRPSSSWASPSTMSAKASASPCR